MFYLSKNLVGIPNASSTNDSGLVKQESSAVDSGCVDIKNPADCEGCAYNWGSFNVQPDDAYCYMFSEFVCGCKKYTVEL